MNQWIISDLTYQCSHLSQPESLAQTSPPGQFPFQQSLSHKVVPETRFSLWRMGVCSTCLSTEWTPYCSDPKCFGMWHCSLPQWPFIECYLYICLARREVQSLASAMAGPSYAFWYASPFPHLLWPSLGQNTQLVSISSSCQFFLPWSRGSMHPNWTPSKLFYGYRQTNSKVYLEP